MFYPFRMLIDFFQHSTWDALSLLLKKWRISIISRIIMKPSRNRNIKRTRCNRAMHVQGLNDTIEKVLQEEGELKINQFCLKYDRKSPLDSFRRKNVCDRTLTFGNTRLVPRSYFPIFLTFTLHMISFVFLRSFFLFFDMSRWCGASENEKWHHQKVNTMDSPLCKLLHGLILYTQSFTLWKTTGLV